MSKTYDQGKDEVAKLCQYFATNQQSFLAPGIKEAHVLMLALTPKLRGATSESEKAALQNAVTTTDAEIDRLVYELYGLTEEEIIIVEGECGRE